MCYINNYFNGDEAFYLKFCITNFAESLHPLIKNFMPCPILATPFKKRLDLYYCSFMPISHTLQPDVISQLLKLNELWLDGNELNGVPCELGDLTNLTYLDISRNFVESIPNRIGSLTELTDLLLCENHISKLPDTIGIVFIYIFK